MPNLRRRVAAAAARTREAANVLAGTPQVLGLVWESQPVYASAVNQVQSARSNIIYQPAALYEMQAERYR
jgi:hypothetical protein